MLYDGYTTHHPYGPWNDQGSAEATREQYAEAFADLISESDHHETTLRVFEAARYFMPLFKALMAGEQAIEEVASHYKRLHKTLKEGTDFGKSLAKNSAELRFLKLITGEADNIDTLLKRALEKADEKAEQAQADIEWEAKYGGVYA